MNLENLVYRCIEKWQAGRRSKRYGLVTSWDAKNHRAKAAIQPEGTESGWLPVHAHMSGNGYGVVAGLTPGDGQSTGDLVEIVYQEGDFESGMITGRVHNEQDKPPQVQSGEILAQHQSGTKVFLDKNGNLLAQCSGSGVLTIKGAGGSTTVHDASGNITHTDGSGGVVYQSGGNVYLGSKTATLAVKLSDGSNATKVFAV